MNRGLPDEAHRLRLDESDLVGQWVAVDGAALADPVTRRIEQLVAEVQEHIAVTDDGWSSLYRDPCDGRYWERTYPRGGRVTH
jgi:hypothetical protein